MPQLNPAPWFSILVFSWLVFLLLLPAKVMAHQTPNEPSPQSTENPQTSPWNWPWH
uniref:ATP synthase F0 subunit 8 n=1 Tax=Ambassis agassizii TaxID=613159 RepID=UPI0026E29689|nr:ATP synthase F0 subunit 8 [Ambassis agassizii]WJQ22015.1 ATP synthase F0 subunit 8 [Ambassis agassizii]WJQ22028.1 ATP synthase F0 subunit 8 [Ambassis agassizii]